MENDTKALHIIINKSIVEMMDKEIKENKIDFKSRNQFIEKVLREHFNKNK